MSTDSRKRPGRGFASTARASAVSRSIKKLTGVTPMNSANSRGQHGVRVSQEPYAATVFVSVFLDNADQAATWATQIRDTLIGAGYEKDWTSGDGTSFTVTKAEWKFDDTVAAGMFGIDPEDMESDTGLTAARPATITQLRNNGWIKLDTLQLTDLGQQVRERLLIQKRKRAQAEKRRIKARGW